MDRKYEELPRMLIRDLQNFIFELTGEYPSVLSNFESESDYPSFEVSGWSNEQRKRYARAELPTSYAFVYRLSAYGRRIHLYISKLSASVGEIMDDPVLLEDIEAELESGKMEADVFERSMVFVEGKAPGNI